MKALYLIILAAIFLTSCKKESSSGKVDTAPIPVNEVSLVKETIISGNKVYTYPNGITATQEAKSFMPGYWKATLKHGNSIMPIVYREQYFTGYALIYFQSPTGLIYLTAKVDLATNYIYEEKYVNDMPVAQLGMDIHYVPTFLSCIKKAVKFCLFKSGACAILCTAGGWFGCGLGWIGGCAGGWI